MSIWDKLVVGVLVLVLAPLAIAGFAFGCFVMAGLFSGLVLGVLNAIGVLDWSDTTFLVVAVPLAVVVGAVCVVFHDELRHW